MKSRWVGCWLVAPLLLGCRSQTLEVHRQEVSATRSAPAPPREPPPLCVAPTALEGCRGPNQKGCEVCYQPFTFAPSIPSLTGERCWRRSGDRTEERYAQTQMLPGACPTGPRCAPCSLESERKLRKLYPDFWECSPALVVDPCMMPESRECICEPYAFAHAACPVIACP